LLANALSTCGINSHTIRLGARLDLRRVPPRLAINGKHERVTLPA
jgi:hypothetical protein